MIDDAASFLAIWVGGFLFGVCIAENVRAFLRRVLQPLRCKLRLCQGRISVTDYGMAWQCERCGALRHWESWSKIFHDKRTRSSTAARPPERR